MSSARIIRVNELLKREIAVDIPRLFANGNFDTSAVTITKVETGSDLRDATVYVSIFGHEQERLGMIRFLNRHRGEIQSRMSKHVILKYTPRLYFKFDDSLETGDRVLGSLSQLHIPEDNEDPQTRGEVERGRGEAPATTEESGNTEQGMSNDEV
jgi:ribosome-binding factor A